MKKVTTYCKSTEWVSKIGLFKPRENEQFKWGEICFLYRHGNISEIRTS